MKSTAIISILIFAGIMLTANQVIAKKGNSKSYTCISASNGRFLITDSRKTNKFKLYGIVFPTKKNLKQFAKDSDTKVKDLTDFLPNINNQLNKYNGQTVKIIKNFRNSLWLENSNGKSINLDVVENGVALPEKNVKRQYKNNLIKAKCEAIKNAAGIWALPHDSDPTHDIRIKFSSKNVTWNNVRNIILDLNTHDLKRKIDLIVKYQFKIVSYAGQYNKSNKRKVSFSDIAQKTITIYPPEQTNIVIKSPVVELLKHFDSDGREYSFLRGKDYVGEAVAIYYNDKVIFKRGDLK